MRGLLLIGPAQQRALADLTARAAASPTPYATMKALAEKHAQADVKGRWTLAKMNRGLTVELPVGYTVTLTHEEHQPGVMCRHVSVGLRARQGRGPTPEAVNLLLAALGFTARCGVVECIVWLETLEDSTFAVNVVEPLSGDLEELRRSTHDKA